MHFDLTFLFIFLNYFELCSLTTILFLFFKRQQLLKKKKKKHKEVPWGENTHFFICGLAFMIFATLFVSCTSSLNFQSNFRKFTELQNA